MRCLHKEMSTYEMSLWRDPDDAHIVEFCPPTKLNGGLSQLHSADEDAYEKKKNVADYTV